MQEKMIQALQNHVPGVIGLEQCQKAAVCIPFVEKGGKTHILFEVRAAKIRHQPGDICFPGGMCEDGELPEQAAVRELCEELLVPPASVRPIGLMDLMIGSRIAIYPYAVRLLGYAGSYSPDEVDRVFLVPLSFFLENEPERYQIRLSVILPENFPYDRIVGGKDYHWRKRSEEILFYQYGEYAIWGMTAKIMWSLAEILKQSPRHE